MLVQNWREASYWCALLFDGRPARDAASEVTAYNIIAQQFDKLSSLPARG
jgi:hypothetical protein